MRKLIWMLMLLLVAAVGTTAAKSSAPDPKVGKLMVRLQPIADGLTSPVFLTEAPDDSGRLFIVDQVGQIWILTTDGTMLDTPFLDVADRLVDLDPGFDERGLLGLAFHPDYANNGRFFIYYSAPLRPGAPPDYNTTATFSEFHVSADPAVADPNSEIILLEIDKPQFNHNGGTLAFGPDDGYLYISIGDGGGANDIGLGHVEDWYADNAGGNGQDVTENLLGNILRIDVDGGTPYAIPPDNPFVGRDGLDEIFAYGLRNPYRMSFDMGGGHQLFVGDAGQNLWEEVSIVELGGNYGWNVKEGTHCFDAEDPDNPPPDCPDVVGPGHPDEGAPLLDPVIEYANLNNPHVSGVGVVVVGGYVYRGNAIPPLVGQYVFGDWSRSFTEPDGTLLAARPHGSTPWNFRELRIQHDDDGRLGHFLLAFGQDAEGEIYVLTNDMTGPSGTTGMVFKLLPPGPPSVD